MRFLLSGIMALIAVGLFLYGASIENTAETIFQQMAAIIYYNMSVTALGFSFLIVLTTGGKGTNPKT